jgi:hypothetical protein
MKLHYNVFCTTTKEYYILALFPCVRIFFIYRELQLYDRRLDTVRHNIYTVQQSANQTDETTVQNTAVHVRAVFMGPSLCT